MCRWRQISDTYAGCGHAYRHEDEIVHCEDHLCKFSPYHDANCGPNCRDTCWQYRKFPEQINRRFDRKCGPCVEAERLAAQAAYEAQQAAQGGRR